MHQESVPISGTTRVTPTPHTARTLQNTWSSMLGDHDIIGVQLMRLHLPHGLRWIDAHCRHESLQAAVAAHNLRHFTVSHWQRCHDSGPRLTGNTTAASGSPANHHHLRTLLYLLWHFSWRQPDLASGKYPPQRCFAEGLSQHRLHHLIVLLASSSLGTTMFRIWRRRSCADRR